MRHANQNNLRKLKFQLEDESKEINSQLLTGVKSVDSFSLLELRELQKKAGKFTLTPLMRQRLFLLSRLDDIEETLRYIDKQLTKSRLHERINTESEIGLLSDSGLDGTSTVNIENLMDTETKSEEANPGPTRNWNLGQQEHLDLGEFLSRPVPIANFQLSPSIVFNGSYDVWDLWSLVPSVRSKLRNYAYFRGDLKVRISISGTPFHYGKMLVSYQPFAASNANLTEHAANLALTNTWHPLYCNYLSQAPGAITMDVRDNIPVEIICPFMSAKPMHRLFNNSAAALGAATSYDDFADAGRLYFFTLNEIGCVSATPSDCYVYIYAYMENVELGTTTATQIAITTESEKDERVVGPIERVSSGVASFLGHLTKVPYIGDFALASQMLFNGVAGVSSIFGWSKPTIIQQPQFVKNVGFQNGALTIGYDTNYKITLDPKQELTIDSSFLSGGDDMVITQISSRPSYITTFTWAENDAIMTTPIFLCGVTPMLGTYLTDVALVKHIQPSSMQFAATPFQYWRGDIHFKIEIVCSAFHRGKIAIFYEPNSVQYSLITSAQATNKQFMKIIDIQETQSVEFSIGWAQTRSWAVISDQYTKTYGATFDGSVGFDIWNGFIGVIPFTRLQTPDASDVKVNVYAFCPDLQVNFFTSVNLPDERLPYTTESEKGCLDDGTDFYLNESSADSKTICLDHFGERPVSFRSLLKRYVLSLRVTLNASASTPRLVTLTSPIMPSPEPTYGNTGSILNLYGYLRYAYVGVRGSMRKRYGLHSDFGSEIFDQASVSLDDQISGVTTPAVNNYADGVGVITRGGIIFVPSASSGVEVELPYYSVNLYSISFADDLVGTGTGMYASWIQDATFAFQTHGGYSAGYIMEHIAVGDDFSFIRYQGAPCYSIT